MPSPPPLPPRKSPELPPPPPYSPFEEASPPEPGLRLFADPRTSSSQSLVPSLPAPGSAPRRTLLVVYIHGFYGNDQSFRSFPPHVHGYLRHALSDSHVIHSKIYPRYKTYKSVDIARDNFSAWLEPHESPTTDVILVGHSMGGLLAAEVVLKPCQSPYHQRPFKHRILGTLSLDSPFLGLHPGIVVSGISSLFQPAPRPPDDDPSPPEPPQISPQPTDPNFDPPFFNDQPFREQPFITRMIHFASKHRSEGLLHAMGNHIVNHLEFGGCLADYHGLMSRYNRIRALEDVDEAYARVRFVNYYTLSSGRPKPPQSPTVESRAANKTDVSTLSSSQCEAQSQSQKDDRSAGDVVSPSSLLSLPEPNEEQQIRPNASISIPEISMKDDDCQEHIADQYSLMEDDFPPKESMSIKGDEAIESPPDSTRLSMHEIDPVPMESIEPVPMEEEELKTEPEGPGEPPEDTLHGEQVTEQQSPSLTDLSLPPLPEPPTRPDFEQYTDKDSRKQAEKEFRRLQKMHDQALKDRTKTLREREKLVEKRRKKAQKEADKVEKEARKEKDRLEKQEKKRLDREAAAAAAAKQANEAEHVVAEAETRTLEMEKPKKLNKFCNLPGKINGATDPTWVDVYMDGVDEVGAHCGLFFPGPHYDKLVGDVAGRIAGWVHDDLSKRALLDMGC